MGRDFEKERLIAEKNEEGRQAEAGGDIPGAIKLYEESIRLDYPDPVAFDRLMILYRRQKQYKDEIRVINKAIKVFSQDYERHRKEQLPAAHSRKKVRDLSAAIMKKAGLYDRKGNDIYAPEPIARWMKRKAVAVKRMSASKG